MAKNIVSKSMFKNILVRKRDVQSLDSKSIQVILTYHNESEATFGVACYVHLYGVHLRSPYYLVEMTSLKLKR